MSIPLLRDVVAEYKKSGKALGHFNFSDSNQLKAIAMAAKEANIPVVVGLSEGEREFFPIPHARALVDLYNTQGTQLYLNADHTYSLEKAKAAINAGVDSIVVDGAKLSFDENAALLKQVVAYAHQNDFFGFKKRALVEGELGYIGTSSSVMATLPEGAAITEAMMTKPEELKKLVEETGIDIAAPAVGNIHGIVTSGQPKLSIGRIGEIAHAVSVPIVLHGGSGSGDDEFVAAVKAGISLIHINTDLRVLYRDSLKSQLDASPETTPYKFLTPSVEAMTQYVLQKIKLFANA
jgi:fructose-bisphosphate aldolase class II